MKLYAPYQFTKKRWWETCKATIYNVPSGGWGINYHNTTFEYICFQIPNVTCLANVESHTVSSIPITSLSALFFLSLPMAADSNEAAPPPPTTSPNLWLLHSSSSSSSDGNFLPWESLQLHLGSGPSLQKPTRVILSPWSGSNLLRRCRSGRSVPVCKDPLPLLVLQRLCRPSRYHGTKKMSMKHPRLHVWYRFIHVLQQRRLLAELESDRPGLI